MASKKKVLFTSHTANFQKFNRPFMRMLSEQGWEVHYASAGEEEILDADKAFTVPFERSPLKSGNLKAYFALKKIIDHEKYDMIHTHTPMGSVVTRLAARAARKQGTRVIYTAHGFHFFKGAPIANWLIYYPIEKLMARFTDTLITINDEDYSRAKRKLKTDVVYVPGVGIDLRILTPNVTKRQRQSLRTSLGLGVDDFVLIYPAELNSNKNQRMLVNVMRELVKHHPKVHLLLPGKDTSGAVHEKLISDNDLADNIHLLGYRSDIPELLSISDLSVSASYREGLPVHVMEAMGAGLPNVSMYCRGVSELVSSGENGYITDVDDVPAMVSKISSLIDNAELRNAMGIASKKLAVQYDIKSIKEMMSTIYSESSITHSRLPVRILHIVTIMDRAGLETMLMNYYRSIDRSLVQFDFLVHRDEEGDFDSEILQMGGRIYHASPIKPLNILKYRSWMRKFLGDHPEYNIVHSHLDALSALPLAGARAAGIDVRIAHSHNAGFSVDGKMLIRKMLRPLIPIYATDLLACSSEAGVFMFGRKNQFKIIPNAISTNRFSYSKVSRRIARGELHLAKDTFVVGHIGRFSDQKNHTFLIDIFKEMYEMNNAAVLLLAGKGELEGSIRDKVHDLGLQQNVRFLGVRSDVDKILQAFDVFVMPSKFEGLPLISIEAQSSGLKSFFSDVVSRELDVSDESDFLSLSMSAKDWADTIMQAGSSEDRAEVAARVSRSAYNVDKSAPELREYYLGKWNG